MDVSQTQTSDLLSQLEALYDVVAKSGGATYATWSPRIERRSFRPGAHNLALYLAMRQHDLRELQTSLMMLGLSSLGRSEAHVKASIEAVLATLETLSGSVSNTYRHPTPHAYFRGPRFLERNATELFGPEPQTRRNRIMVTLPSEAASSPDLVAEYIAAGMNCARINCSHDDPSSWQAMVQYLELAKQQLGRSCSLLMDLSGPKTRTADVVAPDTARLHTGDQLLLHRGSAAPIDQFPFQLTCTIREVVDQLPVGTQVWIDDGKLGTIVESILPEGLVLRVTRTRPKGERLRQGKGMNFPDALLDLSPLTASDLHHLDFVVANADIVGYSFVQSATDIERLDRELRARESGRRSLGIIAKIETQRAVSNLPEIIVAGASRRPLGVMIARGDLAVEIGFARTAEMQEEILWLCEAAYVPVIWATQVLESLVTKGLPSRSEMTDAAMAQRAECVMLNKGPYVVDAIRTMDEMFARMQSHQVKKTAQLRALRSWPL